MPRLTRYSARGSGLRDRGLGSASALSRTRPGPLDIAYS